MAFNAGDFLVSADFNSTVTSLVEAKTYNWYSAVPLPPGRAAVCAMQASACASLALQVPLGAAWGSTCHQQQWPSMRVRM